MASSAKKKIYTCIYHSKSLKHLKGGALVTMSPLKLMMIKICGEMSRKYASLVELKRGLEFLHNSFNTGSDILLRF